MSELHSVIKRSLRNLPSCQGLLIAMSGGPDSTCLFHLLLHWAKEHSRKLKAVHFAYGLRGDDSEEEYEFIQALCEKNKVELLCQRATDEERKDLLSGGLQEKARSLRHAFFARLAKENDMFVALGHHRDDQVETFLLHLLRGAGLSGLCGMEEISGHLFRPLLSVSRQEILHYLEENKFSYRIDSSNEELKYKRNEIRHRLIPALQEAEPAANQLIARTMGILRRDNDFLLSAVKEARVQCEHNEPMSGRSLTRKALIELHPALRMRCYYEILIEMSASKEAVSLQLCQELDDMVLAGVEGQKSSLRKVIEVTFSRDALYFIPFAQQKSYCVKVPIESANFQVAGFSFQTTLHETSPSRPLPPTSLFLPLKAIKGELEIRPPKEGERCSLLNFEGHKKILALLADNKVPLPLRQSWPLLVDERGILWVSGLRRTDLVKELGDEPCLEIKMVPSAAELSNR